MRRSLSLVALLGFAFSSTLGQTATSLPDLTNIWEKAHLYVVDKDTNSVFINANDLFLSTVRPNFPEIQTVSNLIGKTDFDFYSVTLANGYRADDQRVITGSVPVEIVEKYQPVGAPASFVHTTKTPLIDANGNVYALRIVFYNIPEPGLTTLPVFPTDWLREHAISIDKDTNSVFLNANETFLATLRPTFPNIKTVTNLIGRNDFYFYPVDLAEKFRADDARVMASGREFVTIEPNQPLGGAVTYFQVTKRPLHRPDGSLMGLRILAWELPQLQVQRAAAAVKLTYPKAAAEFVLQRSPSLQNPVWETVTVDASANDVVSASVSPGGTQSYFRLFLTNSFIANP